MKAFDFQAVESVFRKADSHRLLEHQFYQVLNAAGIPTPVWFFWERGKDITREILEDFPGERVVLKIVSPLITHKSDVGGVRFV
ncbi:MAG: acetate--CoA ligase family protein, partial [Candidatus Aminicenantaceae bacterium]